ncbi:unnamed protein product, partial [Prorocentrum cordatum]
MGNVLADCQRYGIQQCELCSEVHAAAAHQDRWPRRPEESCDHGGADRAGHLRAARAQPLGRALAAGHVGARHAPAGAAPVQARSAGGQGPPRRPDGVARPRGRARSPGGGQGRPGGARLPGRQPGRRRHQGGGLGRQGRGGSGQACRRRR